MSGYYAANPHYAPVDNSEERERQERAEIEAGRWFDDLTKPQRDRYTSRYSVIAAHKGSPRWDLERETIEREWRETTADAARVSDMVLGDMLALGEISEATAYAFDECLLCQTMAQAAE